MPKTSLLDSARQFMVENKRLSGRVCGTCSLPPDILEAVHTLKAEGNSAPVMAKWLKHVGHEIGHAALKHHLANHELKEKA